MSSTTSAPANARISIGGPASILLASALWSTGGVFMKILEKKGIPDIAIASGRSLITTLVFLVLAQFRLKVRREHIWRVAAGAVSYGLVVTTFVFATNYTTSANAIVLQYTSLLWILILGWIAFGERPSKFEIIALGMGAVGVILCMWKEFSRYQSSGNLSRELTGELLAIFSGFCFGMITLVLRGINRDKVSNSNETSPALVCLVFGNLLAGLVGLPQVIASVQTGHIQFREMLFFLWLGGPQLGGAYWFYQHGLRTTRAFTANLLSLLEPLLNPVWVAIFAHELPAKYTYIGAPFVLGAIVLSMMGKRETTTQIVKGE